MEVKTGKGLESKKTWKVTGGNSGKSQEAIMENLNDKIRKDLESLCEDGNKLIQEVMKDRALFSKNYQIWFSQAIPVINLLLPERISDFKRFYDNEERRPHYTPDAYSINDFICGLSCPGSGPEEHLAQMKVRNQAAMVEAALNRLDDGLGKIKSLLQFDLFDNEIDASRHLLENGHLRAAGTVAGVVLEGHLKTICANHGVTLGKSNPTLSDYYDALKSANVLEIPTWRKMQQLGDLRNLCVHAKERDPSPEEVQELINGTDKAIKTIF